MNSPNESRYLYSKGCQDCGSRDARGVYTDHEFCFKCHHYVKRPAMRFDNIPIPRNLPPADLKFDLPPANYNWLREYLTDAQIKSNFWYSPSMDRHVFKVGVPGLEGQYYIEARSVTGEEPKSLSWGMKPYRLRGRWYETSTIVVVEDIVSSIKLEDFFGTMCLFGSSCPADILMDMIRLKTVEHIIWWLDLDAMEEAMYNVRKCRMVGKRSASISTEKDPKALSIVDIKNEVEHARVFANETAKPPETAIILPWSE